MKEEKKLINTPRPASQARYISGADVDSLIDLLVKLRDLTLSRSVYEDCTSMLIEIGGADWASANRRLRADTT